MKIIDLFSGIGGFSLGFQRAGYQFTEHYFSEIDKHAIANYKHNFPHAKHIGDITTLHGGDFRDIDIITFGSPCVDFSLAGRRKGLKGSKSSLIEYAITLIANIRPSIFIWENVKGVFSSNAGADFWAILKAFTNIGGYTIEWQLLNTSWVLPQNRERLYLIGHLAGRSTPGVFPIGKNDFTSISKAQILYMNKRKEIESFLGEDFYKTEINDKNIQEIEKKYKVAKSFVIKEIIIQSIITVVVFFHLRFATSDFPIIVYGELGNTIYYVLSVLIRAITVVWILRAALNIYALMKYKSKIKKYYQN